MKLKSNLKAGGMHQNHNQAAGGLKLKSSVNAGGISVNHNQTALQSR